MELVIEVKRMRMNSGTRFAGHGEGCVRRSSHLPRAIGISAALLGCAAATGCTGYERSLGPVALLDAVVDAEGVHLSNRDDEPIYFFVVAADHVLTESFGFTPCDSPAECPAVAPETSHVVPFEGILGLSSATRELFVYYWLLRPAGGGEHVAVAVEVLILRMSPRVPPESGLSH